MIHIVICKVLSVFACIHKIIIFFVGARDRFHYKKQIYMCVLKHVENLSEHPSPGKSVLCKTKCQLYYMYKVY